MTSTWSNGFAVAVSIIAVIGALGAAGAYFRVSYMKATVQTQKETIEAQSQRIDEYEQGQHDRDRQITDLQAKVHSLDNENHTLRGVISGREAIKELADLVKAQHAEIHEELVAAREGQKAILAALPKGPRT